MNVVERIKSFCNILVGANSHHIYHVTEAVQTTEDIH